MGECTVGSVSVVAAMCVCSSLLSVVSLQPLAHYHVLPAPPLFLLTRRREPLWPTALLPEGFAQPHGAMPPSRQSMPSLAPTSAERTF